MGEGSEIESGKEKAKETIERMESSKTVCQSPSQRQGQTSVLAWLRKRDQNSSRAGYMSGSCSGNGDGKGSSISRFSLPPELQRHILLFVSQKRERGKKENTRRKSPAPPSSFNILIFNKCVSWFITCPATRRRILLLQRCTLVAGATEFL